MKTDIKVSALSIAALALLMPIYSVGLAAYVFHNYPLPRLIVLPAYTIGIALFLYNLKKIKIINRTLLVMNVIAWVVMLITIFLGPKEIYGYNLFYENIKVLIFSFSFFWIGYSIKNSKEVKSIIIGLWILVIIFLLVMVDIGSDFLSSFNQINEERRWPYLYIGDSFVIWSLLALGIFYQSRLMTLFVSALSLMVSYTLYTRASFISIIAVIFLYLLLSWDSVIRIFAMTCFGVFSFLLSRMAENRMFSLFKLHYDASFLGRQIQLYTGIDMIQKNPLWGKYGGQMYDLGNYGDYIHNLLSYWQQYGLVVFLIMTIQIVLIGKWAIKKIKGRPATSNGISIAIALVTIFLIIEQITARAYTQPFIWLCFGYWIKQKGKVESGNIIRNLKEMEKTENQCIDPLQKCT